MIQRQIAALYSISHGEIEAVTYSRRRGHEGGEVYLSRARVESSASHKVLFIFFLELCRQDFEERGLPGTAVATGDLRRWEGGRAARAAR